MKIRQASVASLVVNLMLRANDFQYKPLSTHSDADETQIQYFTVQRCWKLLFNYFNTLEKSAMSLPVKTYVFDCTLRRQKTQIRNYTIPKFFNQITNRLFEHWIIVECVPPTWTCVHKLDLDTEHIYSWFWYFHYLLISHILLLLLQGINIICLSVYIFINYLAGWGITKTIIGWMREIITIISWIMEIIIYIIKRAESLRPSVRPSVRHTLQ